MQFQKFLKFKEFAFFGINGATATALNYLVLKTLTAVFGLDLFFSTIFSNGAGITASFIGNSFFVFKTKDYCLNKFWKFVSLYCLTAFFFSITLSFLVERMFFLLEVAFVLATLFQMLVNFFASKYWIFRNV